METYQGHVDAVFSLCIDEAGALYSASLDGSVKRWSYMTRRTAFSFEDRSGSVSSLTVLENHIFVSTRSGSLNIFDLSDTTIQGSVKLHSNAITSLITDDIRVFSSGLDGMLFSMRPGSNENATMILNSSPLSLKGLFNLKNDLFLISDDTEIISIGINSSKPATKRVTSGIPLNCLSGYKSLILGCSKSGSIFAWSLDTAALTYELRGHSSQVNSLGISGDLLVSASDDQSIIIWSLVDFVLVNVLKRVSSDSLGHIGPINSVSLCGGFIFSGGSDTTTRRWNMISGIHEDVYFGASKSTTTVLCHNETVYSGSEDSAVFMFRPTFSRESDYKWSTGTFSRDRRLVQTRSRQRISFSGMMDIQTIIPMIIGIAILAVVIVGCTIYIVRYRNSKARLNVSPGQKTSSEESSQTVTDLQTVVNSVIGISKHAAFLVEKWAVARDKKIAAGGGGELYLAKVMDPALKKKAGDTVIQKVVFLKSKSNEDAFFQEVGIMIMLSSFPCFCSIIAYTEDPFSMILKYYPEGSLHEWLRSTKYNKKVAVAIFSDTASALKIMHSYYLAHCDLKSKNILVELVNGQPSFRLTDFGITQILSEKIMDSRSFKIINLRGLSVDYASPEAFRNFRTSKYVRVDFKMYDIYSYGCLVKEVLTKASPWG
jgi:serine/threonine protein kinase